ncbi:hypothetical protein AAG570_006690 [Ranatra chinensis]|uniref:Mitochondrial inner membrane protein Mpv17 n=1 Tax=Ranatra chinensis TaxID=642074 RepID=A0ABD0YUT4_9HEMI
MLALGDVICQTMIEKRQFDWMRLARFSAMGAVLGPVIQVIYTVMERKIGTKVTPINTVKKVSIAIRFIKNVAVDQLLCSPVLLATFMTCIGLMEGRSLAEVKEKLRASYLDILIANYKVWPLVQMVNFAFMPLNYRVLFLQGVAVGWNTFLSWKMHQEPLKKE